MNGIEQIICGEICLEGQTINHDKKASHLLEIHEISDILNEICLEGQTINHDKKTSHLLEIHEISDILNEISDTSIDDEFSINNNGINYKLGNDSKIISKIYEIIIIDKLKGLLDTKGYKYIENEIQNKYPDFIIISKIQEEKFYAVDIKSSYLKTKTEINGFTLGTYKGYFKNRDSLCSIVKPYNNFIKHFCICVIYSRTGIKIPVKHIIVKEKWEIARNGTGSGNTCNIGSVKLLSDLLGNKPYFANEDEFNAFWLSYEC